MPRLLADHWQRAVRIGLAVMRGAGKKIPLEGKQARGQLDRSGRGHQMPDRALDRADGDAFRLCTERSANGAGLRGIVQRRAGAVRVDVPDFRR